MTLIVNFFGGPGTGKSTHTAALFTMLKKDGINAEMAHEYAKDLVWEGRHSTLAFQPYVAAKQMHRVHRLIGKVDVVVTDSPILLCPIYGTGIGYHKGSFDRFIVDSYKGWNTLNIFLIRNPEHHPYNPKGRNQTEEEAKVIDKQIRDYLSKHGIPHYFVTIGASTDERVYNLTRDKLNGI